MSTMGTNPHYHQRIKWITHVNYLVQNPTKAIFFFFIILVNIPQLKTTRAMTIVERIWLMMPWKENALPGKAWSVSENFRENLL